MKLSVDAAFQRIFTILEIIFVAAILAASVIVFGEYLYDIFWYLACAAIFVGLIIFAAETYADSQPVTENDEAGNLNLYTLILIVPAVCVLATVWIVDSMKESSQKNLEYVLMLLKWVSIVAFSVGLIWTIEAGIIAIWKCIARHTSK